MSLKYAALTAATLALCSLVDPAPAAAQPSPCVDMYNRLMALYQTAPGSPEYAQMSASYSASCVGGVATAPAYPQPYYAPGYAPGYYPPAYYGPPIGIGVDIGIGRGGWRR